ncbi:MAG: membrane-bound lytic murein transglycosylase MltF [Candidatus Krumholzibacteriota bacterium]|nr:membrane-bound lytic murein transglycosylase MltF [Candidatus Krumholzibacteriota bacterium]
MRPGPHSARRRPAALAALGVLAALAAAGLLAGCDGGPFGRDRLDAIRERGRLVVLTRNNAHCYYTYRDAPMGFEYDLAAAFAESLGVDLELRLPAWNSLIPSLAEGEGDLIAASLTRTPAREKRVDFCQEYLRIKQRLIRNKSEPKLKSLADLAGREVHVRAGSSYESRLRELAAGGLDVTIVVHDDLPTEELIRRVADGEIELTVADTNVALLNRRYYPDIRVGLDLSAPQSLAWAVPKGEKALRRAVNRFFRTIMQDGTFAELYDRYYASTDVFDYVDLKRYHQRLATRLPDYEAVIREAAAAQGFDWRLIAAIVYQESHFQPRARSHTGVRGLMQLTLDTAQEMGVADRLDPVQSVQGGARYLSYLHGLFEGVEEPDRTLLTLAAYNTGRGHVLDAQGIAARQGLDPDKWVSVAQTLPLLREREYYKNARYGYCRGTEPVRYVERILTYYEILKREAME